MNEHDPKDDYASWVEARRTTPVPAGFSARVMERVRAEARPDQAVWPRPWISAVAWAAASVVLLMRVGAVIGVFWPT